MKSTFGFVFLLIPMICAAQYSSYATSPSGTDVACGGQYSSYATSPDGRKVCAGGRNSGK
jgi:hypothetical protein